MLLSDRGLTQSNNLQTPPNLHTSKKATELDIKSLTSTKRFITATNFKNDRQTSRTFEWERI